MTHRRPFTHTRLTLTLAAVAVPALAVALLIAVSPTSAQGSTLHPTFALLDADGQPVVETGSPVSTTKTCGQCHDTTFIAEHNAHADILVGALTAPAGESVMYDIDTGRLVMLDEAGTDIEANCFLCHSTTPDNDARLRALERGDFEWANTATLAGTGIVGEDSSGGFTWNPDAFEADGTLREEYVQIQDPAVENCALCHGVATSDAITPLALHTCGTEQRTTITTGQIYSPQRISDSGLNIAGKDDLTRTWDVHAERVVGCTDCHYSLNNPAYATEPDESRPEHLTFDPRRLEPGEYLTRPLHEFARSSEDVVTDHSCASCHETQATHAWLPYTERHMEAVACETCHVPRLEASARQLIDWTVLADNGGPTHVCRGQVPDGTQGQMLLTGYEPVLLPRENLDGSTSIAPYNLITTWYWVAGADGQPVAVDDLEAAYFEGESYHPDVLDAFDADGSGTLSSGELVIDTDAKEALIAGRLAALGLDDPRIEAGVESYPIYHGVTHGEWAISECETCHGDDSRLAQPIALASSSPGGVAPTLDGNPLAEFGEITTGADGQIEFQTNAGQRGDGRYIFGYSHSKVVDWIGALAFAGTLLGVFAHGGLRFMAARRQSEEEHEPELHEVYMYQVYERLWHWLQTGVILILFCTGLIIHKPDVFGAFNFRWVVQVHNVAAAILIANAALALFYHLASGEIRQFLPEPRGFFNGAILQARYYLQGIFNGDEHPFEKRPERKMNPLQQVTYLAILNVLLPLQVITGALMWGAQRWPDLANRLGGLPALAPIHTLIAWLFASFIVMHVYLTTTGPTPLAGIKGMMLGWDEVEAESGAK